MTDLVCLLDGLHRDHLGDLEAHLRVTHNMTLDEYQALTADAGIRRAEDLESHLRGHGQGINRRGDGITVIRRVDHGGYL